MTSGCRSSLPASVAWTPWTIRRPDLWPSRISAPSQELAGEASGACEVLSFSAQPTVGGGYEPNVVGDWQHDVQGIPASGA